MLWTTKQALLRAARFTNNTSRSGQGLTAKHLCQCDRLLYYYIYIATTSYCITIYAARRQSTWSQPDNAGESYTGNTEDAALSV